MTTTPRRIAWSVVVVGSAAACAYGLLEVSRIPSQDFGDLGLGPELPPEYWACLVGLNVLVLLAWRLAAPLWASVPLMTSLIVLVYGAGPVLSELPRGATTYRHLGIAEAVGSRPLDTDFDAYFNWPGFFAGLSSLTEASGVDPLELARWAPVANMLIWAVALAGCYAVFGLGRRTTLLAVWLFVVANWIDQDYLSPQAFAFAGYLVFLTLLAGPLGAFRSIPVHWRDWPHMRGLRHADESAQRRVAALMLVVVVTAAVTVSHQLTPVVLLMGAGALLLVRRLAVPTLPVTVGVIVLLWLLFGAKPYLEGHPPLAGLLQGEVPAGADQRLGGSEGHHLVSLVRLAITGSVLGLAALGVIRGWRRHDLDGRLVLLTGAPFLMLPLQSYGGEMVMRVVLFSLPGACALAAVALSPRRTSERWWPRQGTLACAVLLPVLAAACVVTRYGNTAFDVFSRNELAAIRQVPAVVPPGSVVVAAATEAIPWAEVDYLDYERRRLSDICGQVWTSRACADELLHRADVHAGHGGITVVLTDRQRTALRMLRGIPGKEYDALERRLAALAGPDETWGTGTAVRLYHLSPRRNP